MRVSGIFAILAFAVAVVVVEGVCITAESSRHPTDEVRGSSTEFIRHRGETRTKFSEDLRRSSNGCSSGEGIGLRFRFDSRLDDGRFEFSFSDLRML